MRPRGQSSIGYRTPLAVSRNAPGRGATGSPDDAPAGGRGPQVDPAPRATAIRSPSTAYGSRRRRRRGRRTRPGRRACASTSIRLRTPSVRPSGESSGTRGRQDRRPRATPSRSSGAAASELDGQPEAAAASRWSARLTAVIPGRPGRRRARRPASRSWPGRASAEREPGEDDELVDRVVALDVAGRVGLGVAERAGPRRGRRVVAARPRRSSRVRM